MKVFILTLLKMGYQTQNMLNKWYGRWNMMTTNNEGGG